MQNIGIWELRRVPSRNKKFKYVYTVFDENGIAVVGMNSKRKFDACYIVDGKITTDSSKADSATAYAYTFIHLLDQFSRICKLYTI